MWGPLTLSIIYFFKSKILALKYRFRRLWFYYFFKSFDIKIGSSILIHGGKGRHQFGNNFSVLDRCIFECHEKNSEFVTGKNCTFSYGVVCCINTKIKIGDNVWVGEYSSIRNSTHSFSVDSPMGTLNDKWEDIYIGNNVWIGRGTLILPGARIGNNVVIAANSVVKGEIKSNALYGGAPARLIKLLS